MVNIKTALLCIVFKKGPMTRNQLYDAFTREFQIRETRENFESVVDSLVSDCRLIKVGSTVI
jgi:hypothetical protein